MTGFIALITSANVQPLDRSICQPFIFSFIDFIALFLTAGSQLVNHTPRRLFFAILGLKVYPRKSKDILSWIPLLLLSLQYTIFVFTGWSSKPHSFIFLLNSSLTFTACVSLLQCMIAS